MIQDARYHLLVAKAYISLAADDKVRYVPKMQELGIERMHECIQRVLPHPSYPDDEQTMATMRNALMQLIIHEDN